MRKLLIILVALTALVVAAPALAAKISGGTTTVTPSEAAAKLLSDNGISATPIAPATASDGAFTFPIARGRINDQNHGYVLHRGGVKLTKGDNSVSLRRPLIVSTKKGAVLAASTGSRCRVRRGHRRRGRVVCVFRYHNIARLTDAKVSGTTATATLKLTPFSAGAINRLAGKDVVKAGDTLGTVEVKATVKS